MDSYESVDHVLDFAIEREEEAADFYSRLAAQVERTDMQRLFRQFADEEKGHKAKLLGVKQGKHLLPVQKQVLDLKMGDYLVAGDPTGQISYQDALILAMKREKASFRFYTDLADKAPSDDLRNTFLSLAQEEAKHKLRFEVEYDDQVMTEN